MVARPPDPLPQPGPARQVRTCAVINCKPSLCRGFCREYSVSAVPQQRLYTNICSIKIVCLFLDTVCSRKYLCTPATSTHSERVFSAMAWMLNKRRMCLTGEHVNEQMFLKENLSWLMTTGDGPPYWFCI